MAIFKFIKYDSITALFTALTNAASTAATNAANTAIANYVVNNSNVSASYTFDFSLRDNQIHNSTITGNIASIMFNNITAGKTILWNIKQGGAGGFTLPTMPASVKLPGGAAIDLNLAVGGITAISFTCISSTEILCTYVKF